MLRRRSTGLVCDTQAVVIATTACVHEHISDGALCSVHLEHDDIWCGKCHRAGHVCKRKILSTVPIKENA